MVTGPSTLATAGERLAGRQLNRQLVAGVLHFRPGQMAARRCQEDADCYEVTWVNHMGHCVCVLCVWDAPTEDWFVYPLATMAGQETVKQERLPERFKLTDRMRELLDEARAS